MSKSAHARELRYEPRYRPEALRLVEATPGPSRSIGDTLEGAGLALIALAMWFIAAVIFVPQLSGLF
jgi:hypothetical protein